MEQQQRDILDETRSESVTCLRLFRSGGASCGALKLLEEPDPDQSIQVSAVWYSAFPSPPRTPMFHFVKAAKLIINHKIVHHTTTTKKNPADRMWISSPRFNKISTKEAFVGLCWLFYTVSIYISIEFHLIFWEARLTKRSLVAELVVCVSSEVKSRRTRGTRTSRTADEVVPSETSCTHTQWLLTKTPSLESKIPHEQSALFSLERQREQRVHF